MTTVNFSNVPMNATFTYNGVKYIKDRADKAQQIGTSKPRESFPASYPVEYEAPVVKTQVNDLATPAQINYMRKLGVTITDGMTKRQASAAIDAAKNGDGVGSFGMFYNDGSN